MFCKSCGSQVNDGLKFCPSCGTPVTSKNNVYQSASQQPYATSDYNYQNPMSSNLDMSAKESKSLLIKGILSISFGGCSILWLLGYCIPIVNYVASFVIFAFSIVGLVFGAMVLKKSKKQALTGKAKTGKTLGLVGLILSVVVLAISLVAACIIIILLLIYGAGFFATLSSGYYF